MPEGQGVMGNHLAPIRMRPIVPGTGVPGGNPLFLRPPEGAGSHCC